jgi:hypothetical protein
MSATLLTNDTDTVRPSGRSKLVRVIKACGYAAASALLSAFVAWGSVQYAKGRDANRLDTVEKTLEKSLSREEFKTWAEEQRERLREINDRLRDREK